MPESWSSPESGSPRNPQRHSPPSRPRRGPDPLEQGLDRLVSAGRQLVDGVSGARPGARAGARGGGSSASLRPRLDQLGRWVEDKLDWILDDDEEWREPWQEPARQAEPVPPWEAPPSKRRPLEARSRRMARPAEPEAWSNDSPSNSPSNSPGASPEDWPDDASFVIPRWQRQPAAAQETPAPSPPQPRADQGRTLPGDGRRPLPRSTRLRSPSD